MCLFIEDDFHMFIVLCYDTWQCFTLSPGSIDLTRGSVSYCHLVVLTVYTWLYFLLSLVSVYYAYYDLLININNTSYRVCRTCISAHKW